MALKSSFSSGMRIVLQNDSTALFIGEDTSQTGDPEEARDFKTTDDAIQFCRSRQLTGYSVILRTNDGQISMRVAHC